MVFPDFTLQCDFLHAADTCKGLFIPTFKTAKFAHTGEVNQRGTFVKSLTLEFVLQMNLQMVLTVETFERVDTAVHFM